MESEKLEDLLLLSLSASKGQRERSEVLDVGVTRDKNLREVIVKYSGDIDGLQIPGMEIQKLLAGYAIVKLPEDQIGALVAAREIEYVEMPKNLQTGLYEAKRVSCILPLLSQGDEGAPLDGNVVNSSSISLHSSAIIRVNSLLAFSTSVTWAFRKS